MFSPKSNLSFLFLNVPSVLHLAVNSLYLCLQSILDWLNVLKGPFSTKERILRLSTLAVFSRLLMLVLTVLSQILPQVIKQQLT